MTATKNNQYYEAVGRRKTSVARVRLTPSNKTTFVVNDKALVDYFKTNTLQNKVEKPLKEIEGSNFAVSIKVQGGGTSGQAEASSLGIARALVAFDINNRPTLKKSKLLTRDPRAKERRKFGLKKARKSPQWSKR